MLKSWLSTIFRRKRFRNWRCAYSHSATIRIVERETIVAIEHVKEPAEMLEKFRQYFEGQEALYFERRVLRVRVTNIRHPNFPFPGRDDRATDHIAADIAEIPTPGLPVSLLGLHRSDRPRPLRWNISTNMRFHPHVFPDHWSSGPYGGWSMHFSPELIAGVAQLVAGFPPDQPPLRGYLLIQTYMCSHRLMLRELAKKGKSS